MPCIELLPNEIIRKGNYPAPNKSGYDSLFFHPRTKGKGTLILKEFGKQLYLYCEQKNIPYYCFKNDYNLKINVYDSILIDVFPFKEGTGEDENKVNTYLGSDEVKYNLSLLNYIKIEFKNLHDKIDKNQGVVVENLQSLEDKIDEIAVTLNEVLDELKTGFDAIKSSNLDLDSKLASLCDNLDKNLKIKDSVKLLIEKECKKEIPKWDNLNKDSQLFIITAEWLFAGIRGNDTIDFSPFILQYCRALENELSVNIFTPFHKEIQEDMNTVEDEEKKNKNLPDKIRVKLADLKSFYKNLKKSQPKFTMGEMKFILSKLKNDGDTYINSSILQRLRIRIFSIFNEKVLSNEFLKVVDEISNNYRNESAHPNVLDQIKANNCKSLVKDNLNTLLIFKLSN
ncbi:hypothetical protein [Aurantibacillus circumpalustris]|uniref:hypothetical protein n=1 Tax=Aurantibacillus circumpalustris TaxID=3036359 RepID=UPI00295B516A|nr:hypothetical protein [Aurantibacillus circumpalustris]